MKILTFFSFLFLSAIVQAQDQYIVETIKTTLMPGEQLVFENKAVKFIEVISDSRCPKGVTCIWAGEAKILVEIFENGKCIAEEILTISPGVALKYELNKFLEKADFSLSAFNLQPYPEIEMLTDPSTYRLEMELKKTLKVL